MEEQVKEIKPLSSSEEKEVEENIKKARIKMLMKYPFFGILILHLVVKQDYTIERFGTDGHHFFYNPYFIKNCNIQQINWCLVHCILHCALRHITRSEGKNFAQYSAACDYNVHSILNEDMRNSHSRDRIGLLEEPPCEVLYDRRFDGLSTMEIYNDIGTDGDIKEPLDTHRWERSISIDGTEVDVNNIADDWRSYVLSAANAADMEAASKNEGYGDVPGFFRRMLKELTEVKKNWRQLLREAIEPEATDYSFIHPDNRIDYEMFGCFLPSLSEETQKVNKVMFWIDTSGSVTDDELTHIYSEVVGAINQFDGFEGYMGFFDSYAYDPEPFNSVKSLMEIKPKGGGGTNFHAPFEYIKKHKEYDDTKIIIILTDGYCDFPPEDITDKKVIWLITSKDITAPFGESLYLPLNDNDEEERYY